MGKNKKKDEKTTNKSGETQKLDERKKMHKGLKGSGQNPK